MTRRAPHTFPMTAQGYAQRARYWFREAATCLATARRLRAEGQAERVPMYVGLARDANRSGVMFRQTSQAIRAGR